MARVAVTAIETSATGSRRVKNTVEMPGRGRSPVTWPSTHTRPRRPIQSPSSRATVRTGTGDAGLDCSPTWPAYERWPHGGSAWRARLQLGDPVLQQREDGLALAVSLLVQPQRSKVGQIQATEATAERAGGDVIEIVDG